MHTHFKKNKRVIAFRKHGIPIIGRFQKVEGKYLFLQDLPPIRLDTLREISILSQHLINKNTKNVRS